jgi:predicted nucleic acid-binding protein
MKIYLDVCCLCRPFDDQSVNRILLESEAVKEILLCCTQDWTLVVSDAVTYEISRIRDKTRMKKIRKFLEIPHDHVAITKKVSLRYHDFVKLGIDPPDALHLACAEAAEAVMLTTDDTVIKIIKKYPYHISIEVHNPVEWLMEVNAHGSKDSE